MLFKSIKNKCFENMYKGGSLKKKIKFRLVIKRKEISKGLQTKILKKNITGSRSYWS